MPGPIAPSLPGLAARCLALPAAHVAGVFFGAGEDSQTTPESDGGNLVARVKAYAAAGGQKACP